MPLPDSNQNHTKTARKQYNTHFTFIVPLFTEWLQLANFEASPCLSCTQQFLK